MEKVNLGYSIKNIPYPDERSYKAKLIEQTEALVKRMRWKAIFFNAKDKKEDEKHIENYGLKYSKSPAQVKELFHFENNLFQLVKDVKFRKTRNEFQKKLKDDAQKIRNSEKTLTPADKTSNMYRLTKDEYNDLRTSAVTSKYKKASKKSRKR